MHWRFRGVSLGTWASRRLPCSEFARPFASRPSACGVGIHERTSAGSNSTHSPTSAIRSSRTALDGMSANTPRSSPTR